MANLSLSFPGAPSLDLSVRYLDVAERLSWPFEAMVVAASRDPDIDFEPLIGAPVRLHVDAEGRGKRTWTGVCSFIDQTETEASGVSLYAFRVVPSLWLLGQRRNHRAFLQLSTPAIARALLREWRIEATLRLDERRFPVHAYRVQYGESDLAFLSRLLEDAGISYFFEGGEHLVLTDAPERGEPRPAPIPLTASASAAGPHVVHARRASEVRPGLVEISDFDFEKPLYRASFQAASGSSSGGGLDQHIFAPGAAAEGDPRADRTLLALGEDRRTVGFTTNLVDLAPGVVFSTTAAPDKHLCVITTSLEGTARGTWKIACIAAPCDAPLRPAQKTARPRIAGYQSAVVVGPPGEEIHVDEHGRVRLRFPWDREGSLSDDRTPWIRVAEGWAGAGWGMITMPRVGQEVLVAFLDGDPDQPVVVGRAHGASSSPDLLPPAGKTRSVWRSQSSSGGAAGYHEIAFDDRRGHEMVQVRSGATWRRWCCTTRSSPAGLDIDGDRRPPPLGHDRRATTRSTPGRCNRRSIAGSATRREISARSASRSRAATRRSCSTAPTSS